MISPLSKTQEALRGRKRADMSIAQLHDWIAACDIMERHVKAAKARRTWTRARRDAQAELARRGERVLD